MFIVSCLQIGRRNAFSLKFPFNEGLIEKIKNLPKENRTWNPKDKLWELTTIGLLTLIRLYKGSDKIRFDFGEEKYRTKALEMMKKSDANEKDKAFQLKELEKKKIHWLKYKQHLEENYEQYREIVHKNLKEGIICFKHQIVGSLLIDKIRNILISNEMGLGKGLMVIGYVELNKFNKVVVITPNSLKHNFKNEIEKFTNNSSFHIINWKKNKTSIEESRYIILNYEFFNKGNKGKTYSKWDKLNIKDIDCVILDESHRIKNSKSNTYKNYKKVFNENIFKDKKVSKVFLSGTPIPNRAYEFYNLLKEISPLDFPTKELFYSYYCGMVYNFETGWGYVNDTENMKLEELYHKISPYTYRKRKIDVLDLPDKLYQNIVLEMTDTEYSTYKKIENSVVNDFLTNITHNPLTIMIRLQQYTSQLKINSIVDFVNNVLESGEKIVIIDRFKDSLYKLKEIFGDIACLHTGDQSVEERAQMVTDFQDLNSNIKIFIGSVATCNYGITLTAASKLINITPLFVPSEFLQLTDRIHRIGTKFTVNIYSPIFPETIDEYIMSVYDKKMIEIVKVLDNEDYKSEATNSILHEIIGKLKEKYKT